MTLNKNRGTFTYEITHTALNLEVKIVLTKRPTLLQDKASLPLGLNPGCTQQPRLADR